MSYTGYRSNYIELKIDGNKLDKSVMQYFIRAEYNEDAEDLASSALVITFQDQDFKIIDGNIKKGSSVSAVFGYDNDKGELFSGKVTSKAVGCGEDGGITTTITAMDNSVKLTVNEEPACFKDMTDNEVIEKIAKKCGLKTKFGGLASKNQIKRKVRSIPAGVTKLEAVIRLARDNGNLVSVRGDTLHIQKWGDFDNKAYVFDYKMGNYNVYDFSAEDSVNAKGNIAKETVTTSDVNKDSGKPEVVTQDKPSEKKQGSSDDTGNYFVDKDNISNEGN